MHCYACCGDEKSLRISLRRLGFSEAEINEYFFGSARETLLLRKRTEILGCLHMEQDRLSKIDYLLWLERKKF